MTKLPAYELNRTFDAPIELVWKTWTEPALLARWYGPNIETVIHKLDVKPGGLWLNEMKWGENSNYQKMEYTEVIKPTKLVGLMSNTDENWNISANPMMENWPRTLLTEVTFKAVKNQTELKLNWTPYKATETEISCFAAAMDGLGKGWGSGMDLLEEILGELQL